jgi:hypothetical protein
VKPALGLSLAALALSGCVGTGAAIAPGQTQVALYRGALVARGPEGYCIDPVASRPAAGFAVLAGCALISDNPAMPAIDAFVTIQAGEEGSAGVATNEDGLADLLTSPEGVSLLSATGNAATVVVDSVTATPGVVTVHFTDYAPALADGLEPQEWRAFLDLGGRLTTVGLRGFSRAPLDRDTGLRALGQVVDGLRAANN